jgi:hypothetical protein
MRFMMLIYPDERAEAGVKPGEEMIAEMMRYNEELVRAGALLAGDGLQPSSKGARVRFADGKPSVTDGPFTETREVLGGYWIIDVASKEEAVAWAMRCPSWDSELIEIRQMYEMTDFDIDPASDLGALVDRVETGAARNRGSDGLGVVSRTSGEE